MMEGDPAEAGGGTCSGKSSERTDASTTGGDMHKGAGGGNLDSIEGDLVEGR
jgi:hypothetical protein